MSFFKEFKNEISQAVSELVNDEGALVNEEVVTEATEEEEEAMARKNKKSENTKPTMEESSFVEDADLDIEMLKELIDGDRSMEDADMDLLDESTMGDIDEEMNSEIDAQRREYEEQEEVRKEAMRAALRGERPLFESRHDENMTLQKGNYMREETGLVSEEVTEITKGTMLDGNIVSEGSVNVYGKIKGNVACRGKLVVSGTVVGAARAAEIFTNNAKIHGDITSDGALKIGNGSIIIGNVYGTSAVIAGAVQGDIDVHGPVVIDGTAVIQGNIRSRSVQINNGAAIEGMISQCYAEIDYAALFDKTFSQ